MNIDCLAPSSLSVQTQSGKSWYWKAVFLLFICSLSNAVFSDEVCNGVASESFTVDIPASTTCTATDSIKVGPGVAVGDDVSLFAPGVGFTGPVDVQGSLRIAASNPYQDKVWQTNLTLVEVSAIDTDSIQVSWLPVDDGVTPGDQVNYEIHVSQIKDFLPDATTLKHQQTGIQSAQIDGLTPGETYYARMKASTGTGFTSQSRQHRILMPAQDPVRTAQTVVELPAGSVQGVTSTTLILVSGTPSPQVGDLVTSIDPALLRRVTAVTTNSDSSITLQTTAASLGEVYESVQISSSIALAGVPETSSAASLAYAQNSGTTRSIDSTDAPSVHWSQSGLTLTADKPSHLVSEAPASLIQNMQIQALIAATTRQSDALYAEAEDKIEPGDTLTITGPKAVAIVPGASGGPTLSLVLEDTTKHELCGAYDVDIDAPSDKNGDTLFSYRAFTDLGGGRYSLTLPINATPEQVADSAYKINFTAYVDDVGDNCSGGDLDRFWREQLTFEFDLFVVSSPNFPVSEQKTLQYSGDFSVSNSVAFTFAPALESDVNLVDKLIGYSLEYARLQATADARFEQELRIEAQAAGSIDQTNTLFERQFTKVFMAGYVPVVMKGTLSTSIHIQGNVTGKISAVETLHLGFDELAFGFEYRNGVYSPIQSIEPVYSLSIHGDADAEASLTLTLLPALEITFYEAATGKLIAEPYLTAEAGIHGQIHKDMTWDTSTLDMDYWLTKGSVAGGVDLLLHADLEIFDITLFQWPDDKPFEEVKLIPETPILGLPTLNAQGQGYGHPENSRAMVFVGTHENIPNPFKETFGVGLDAFITFIQWYPPKVIANQDLGYQVLPPLDEGIAHDSFWIDFDRPGTYVVRMGGYSSLGGWARQVASDITVTLTDNDSDGMIDQWETFYGITDPSGDDDGDGLTNLQEFQQANNPTIDDDTGPLPFTYQWATSAWSDCEGECGGNPGIQTRDVWCETSSGGIIVLSSYCDLAVKPASSQSCSTLPCFTPGILNDTGIQACADETNNNISCPVTGYPGQDAEYGRDVTHPDGSDGHAGFSFTKLDASGNPLAASATSWFCVKDNVTGLIWEKKSDDDGLHDKDDRYNWYNTDSTTNGGFEGYADDDGDICYGYNSGDPATFCNTQAYTERVNQTGLCGYHDWRMPTRKELHNILSRDRYNPAIDADYYPNTVPNTVFSFYWSASPYADNSYNAWSVTFAYGYPSKGDKGHDLYVRLVRDGQ